MSALGRRSNSQTTSQTNEDGSTTEVTTTTKPSNGGRLGGGQNQTAVTVVETKTTAADGSVTTATETTSNKDSRGSRIGDGGIPSTSVNTVVTDTEGNTSSTTETDYAKGNRGGRLGNGSSGGENSQSVATPSYYEYIQSQGESAQSPALISPTYTSTGTQGTDIIQGQEGNDRLNGGKGSDIISGGLGRNIYSSQKDGETDVILVSSDKYSVDPITGIGSSNKKGKNADILKGLDEIDRIALIGTPGINASVKRIKGSKSIGIYLGSSLEAIYKGGDLSRATLRSMIYTFNETPEFQGGPVSADLTGFGAIPANGALALKVTGGTAMSRALAGQAAFA